jgi:serine/threonine protein kinase
MAKRKATASVTGAGRRTKRSKPTTITETFVWKPREWKVKVAFKSNVLLLMKTSDRKCKVIQKVLEVEPNSEADPLPFEIWAISMVPDCSRIVTPIHYTFQDPDPEHGTAFYEHYPLGDLNQWKARQFDARNHKPVPESYIWRFFLQMSQALALLQNKIGPNREEREILLHRDIKPQNILVVDICTTYPSFKLHDFDIAKMYRKTDARQPDICGTFEWPPPENPVINTTKADIWALGACVQFLATGLMPVENVADYTAEVFAENNRDPDSAQEYPSPDYYYRARVPRMITPINLSPAQQQQRSIGPFLYQGRECYYPQYSDELNHWMRLCLSTSPGRRSTAERLINDMGAKAREMLKKMGGKAALMDMDVDFGTEA